MTDKGRVERLKKISNNVSLNGALSTHLRLADLLFLIEQAERAQELEKVRWNLSDARNEIRELREELEQEETQVRFFKGFIANDLKPMIDELQERNNRLREALEESK